MRPVGVVVNIAFGAVNLGFDSQAGQIDYYVANGSPPLRRFCVAEAPSRGDGSATRYRNTVSVMK